MLPASLAGMRQRAQPVPVLGQPSPEIGQRMTLAMRGHDRAGRNNSTVSNVIGTPGP